MSEGKLPLVIPLDEGIRPLTGPDMCCYCRQPVGKPHTLKCVILQRKVRVRYTFDIEIEVPHFWDKSNIEFHRNEGSWCANNALTDIKQQVTDDGCLCSVFKCEVLEVPDNPPYRKDMSGKIVE